MDADESVTDHNAWRWAVAMVVGFIGLAMLYTTIIRPDVTHDGWYVSLDIGMLTTGGKAIMGGHFGQVYADRNLYALPLALFVMAPVCALVTHFKIASSPNPIQFLVYGPYMLSFGILTLHAARRLAWDLGVRSRLWAVQLITLFLVVVPEYEWGHLEDMLALTFVLYAMRRVLIGQVVPACLLVSVAISFKEWAVMLVPLLVLIAPAGQRARAAVAACALPCLLVAVFMGFNFHDTLRNMTSPVTIVKGASGHPWIDGTWLGGHSSQVNRLGAVIIALAISWRRRHRLLELELLGTAGLILLVRPLTEVSNYSYYWSPGLLLLALTIIGGRAAAGRRLTWRDWVWPVGAMLWTLPRSNDLTAMLWWAGEAILLAMVAVSVAGPGGFDKALGAPAPAHDKGRPQLTPTGPTST